MSWPYGFRSNLHMVPMHDAACCHFTSWKITKQLCPPKQGGRHTAQKEKVLRHPGMSKDCPVHCAPTTKESRRHNPERLTLAMAEKTPDHHASVEVLARDGSRQLCNLNPCALQLWHCRLIQLTPYVKHPTIHNTPGSRAVENLGPASTASHSSRGRVSILQSARSARPPAHEQTPMHTKHAEGTL